MKLVRATEISPGVVVAVSVNTLDCPAGPLAGRHRATSTSVITRAAGVDGDARDAWLVAATHNTLVTA